jgi:hypothetical protein
MRRLIFFLAAVALLTAEPSAQRLTKKTYIATSPCNGTSPGNQLHIFNALQTPIIIKRITISTQNTAVIVGGGRTFDLWNITAAGNTACTTVTPSAFDSENSLISGSVVKIQSDCTNGPTVTTQIAGCHTSTDEADELNGPFNCLFNASPAQGLVLNLNEGVMIQTVVLSSTTVGVTTCTIEFLYR